MPLLSWVELHGAITHLPLAFLLAVPFFEIGALVLRRPDWRVVSFWLLAAGVVMAVPALITGWITANDLGYTGPHGHAPVFFAWHRLAAFVTTGLAALLLFWRVRSGDVLTGKARLAATALGLVAALIVGATGFLGGRMVFGGGNASPQFEAVAAPPPSAAAPPAELVAAGAKLFLSLPCHSCHRMEGKGGPSGPDLTHEALRHADMDWHIRHLKDPQKVSPGSGMPPFDSLEAAELNALAAYLATRK